MTKRLMSAFAMESSVVAGVVVDDKAIAGDPAVNEPVDKDAVVVPVVGNTTGDAVEKIGEIDIPEATDDDIHIEVDAEARALISMVKDANVVVQKMGTLVTAAQVAHTEGGFRQSGMTPFKVAVEELNARAGLDAETNVLSTESFEANPAQATELAIEGLKESIDKISGAIGDSTTAFSNKVNKGLNALNPTIKNTLARLKELTTKVQANGVVDQTNLENASLAKRLAVGTSVPENMTAELNRLQRLVDIVLDQMKAGMDYCDRTVTEEAKRVLTGKKEAATFAPLPLPSVVKVAGADGNYIFAKYNDQIQHMASEPYLGNLTVHAFQIKASAPKEDTFKIFNEFASELCLDFDFDKKDVQSGVKTLGAGDVKSSLKVAEALLLSIISDIRPVWRKLSDQRAQLSGVEDKSFLASKTDRLKSVVSDEKKVALNYLNNAYIYSGSQIWNFYAFSRAIVKLVSAYADLAEASIAKNPKAAE